MQQNDFRPDFDDDQVIDTYTVGLGASGPGAALLGKTADVGNGLFFLINDPDALAAALLEALTDIIEKSQTFTAATVPASRTSAGEQLYVSIFTPSGKTPYWEGHLRSYRITAAGEIHDKNDACALDDPSGNCFSGLFLPVDQRPPFWDAGEEIPAPGSRQLYASTLTGVPGTSQRASFRHTTDTPAGPLTAADLGVTFPPTAPYSGSVAATDEELTAEIIANVRGCAFGTGANGVPCVPRPWLLSDIFHSDPVVVGQPALYDSAPSYKQFQADHAGRDRVIYAGSNGGFLHGLHAGTWDGAGPGTGYDAGTGEELFGFMPWSSRQVVKDLPHDGGNRDYYFVDGSPSVADAWLYTNPSVAAKQASGVEWRTILVGGLRQGGESYYALDISKPGGVGCVSPATGSGYPCYLWEFPREDSELAPLSQDYKNYMGETWSEPILTKVRVKVGADDNGGKGFERWVAIFAGGYHPSGNPNDHAAYDPTATKGRSIWILDLRPQDG
jgi:type IV pilus assembly protein PilY1